MQLLGGFLKDVGITATNQGLQYMYSNPQGVIDVGGRVIGGPGSPLPETIEGLVTNVIMEFGGDEYLEEHWEDLWE